MWPPGLVIRISSSNEDNGAWPRVNTPTLALHLGRLEVGVLARMKELLAFEEQWRHPVGIVAIDAPPGLDEASRVARKFDRLNVDLLSGGWDSPELAAVGSGEAEPAHYLFVLDDDVLDRRCEIWEGLPHGRNEEADALLARR